MKHMHAQALAQLHNNWGWFLAFGVSLMFLGMLALSFSFMSTLFSVLYLGGFLIIQGLLEAVHAFKMRTFGYFLLHGILGVLYCIAGVYVLHNPAANAVALTLLLAWFFIISGALKVLFSFFKNVPHAGWLTANGIITLLLGILIWQQWPASGLWVLGMFLGIDTLFTGLNWIIFAFAAKKIITS